MLVLTNGILHMIVIIEAGQVFLQLRYLLIESVFLRFKLIFEPVDFFGVLF